MKIKLPKDIQQFPWKKTANITLIIFGILCCFYPLVSGFWQNHVQQSLLSTYDNDTHALSDDDLDKMLTDAQEYNSMLFQTKGGSVGSGDSSFNAADEYQTLLSTSDTGIMGTLSIPKIGVDLPIYHGTDESVLSKGVGHLEGSSLPVGGESTRSVLTAHRGLPTSKLFTRLDELKEGDLFYIDVLDETLAYQVDNIEVVKPEEMDKVDPVLDEDLVTLVTCTPYGINSHRLLVTGKRVDYTPGEESTISEERMSWRELLFTALPFVILLIGMGYLIKLFIERRMKHEKH